MKFLFLESYASAPIYYKCFELFLIKMRTYSRCCPRVLRERSLLAFVSLPLAVAHAHHGRADGRDDGVFRAAEPDLKKHGAKVCDQNPR